MDVSARRVARFVWVISTVTVSMLLCFSPAASAEPLYPVPDPDPFYAQPPDVGAYRPGEIIAARDMPPLPQFPATSVRMLKFRSINSEGLPIAATTLILLPDSRSPGGPLLSYQHIINGLGSQCAPSRALYSSDPKLVIREAPALNLVLQRGWAVALPDHLGPNSAYGAARLGGQITLDGIRAAKSLPDLGLTGSPVAMAGYSGGGMATAWAAAMAPTYAPDLDIVGVAAGGVPMNITRMAEVLGVNPHPAFGLAMAAAIGLEREYPDRFPISTQLNAGGLALRDSIANSCTNEIMAYGAGHSATEFATSMKMTSDPGAWEVGDENSLELYPGVPTAPMYEWHATNDVLIPIDAIDRTVTRYCAAGARVWSQKYWSPDHLTTAVIGLPAALDYLDQRYRGVPAPSNC